MSISRAAPAPDATALRRGSWSTIRRGLALSPELRFGLGFTIDLALVATGGRAVVPMAVQRTIDVIAGAGVDLDEIARIGIVATVATIVTGFASAWMNVRLATVAEGALSDLRVRAFRHIHDLSMLHQASQQRGNLVSRVTTDVEAISRFLSWAGVQLLAAVAQVIVALAVMLWYSWELTFVTLGALLPFALVSRWFQHRLVTAYLEVRQRIGHLLAVLSEAVVGAPVVRAYGVEDRTRERLEHAIDEHRRAGFVAGGLSAGYSGTGEAFTGLATAAVLAAGVWFGIEGIVSPGTVVAFPFLIVLFLQPLQMAAEMLNEAQTAVAGWSRVIDVLDMQPDVADPVDGVDLPDGPLGVAFDGVGFRYPKVGETGRTATGFEALKDVGVEIEPLSSVAVVGETGSGKTTFAKLLTRLMDATTGEVRVGGVPIDRVRFASLRRRVVMVPQDDVLFDGTVADNIRYVRPDASDDDVRQAFERLGLGDWLEGLPQGLRTSVGERGATLSAGERQLVSLVRASLADPDLLVLDEATSAVDPATEVRLTRAVEGLARGRTTVTIAHRLSTAERADVVLVFDDGRLVEVGSHGELVRRGGVYAGLHRSWVSGRDGTAA